MYEWLSVSMCWGQEGDVENQPGEQGDARFPYSYTYVNLLKETELNTWMKMLFLLCSCAFSLCDCI